MKKNLMTRFLEFFKRKEYIDEEEHEEIGYTKSSLINVAKTILEEEERTKELKSKLENKLRSLNLISDDETI